MNYALIFASLLVIGCSNGETNEEHKRDQTEAKVTTPNTTCESGEKLTLPLKSCRSPNNNNLCRDHNEIDLKTPTVIQIVATATGAACTDIALRVAATPIDAHNRILDETRKIMGSTIWVTVRLPAGKHSVNAATTTLASPGNASCRCTRTEIIIP